MAKYKVIHAFTDLQDSRTVYNVGDEYPRKGVHPSEERISELSGKKNRQGIPLIKEVKVRKKKKKTKE